mgnify:CR=1 FL=1|tara:strand:+ start:850 stop:1434 length:585 start_codon:yes stop_codon:yes gene_type:complete
MSLYFVGDLNVMYDKRLTPSDKLVYYCLVGFMNVKDGKCYPRYATIKERTGISISSIQRSIKHLARHNLITVKRLASTNLYYLGRQKILQETIKKRVIGKFDISDKSNRGVLIKPSYITNKSSKYNKTSSPQTDKHSISYKGETYEEVGKEGFWNEYFSKKTGLKIRKHSFKDIVEVVSTSKKKFEEYAKRAAS